MKNSTCTAVPEFVFNWVEGMYNITREKLSRVSTQFGSLSPTKRTENAKGEDVGEGRVFRFTWLGTFHLETTRPYNRFVFPKLYFLLSN